MPTASQFTSLLTITREAHYWSLEGVLTMQALSAQWRQLEKDRPSETWVINIEKISRIDSAGLAFLLGCIRDAKSNNVRLSIEGVHDEDWYKLMQVHGVYELMLPFIGECNANR